MCQLKSNHPSAIKIFLKFSGQGTCRPFTSFIDSKFLRNGDSFRVAVLWNLKSIVRCL